MRRVLVILFLISVYFSKATHNRAGEILYKRIAPFTATVNGNVVAVYRYYFQINTYTEINSPGGNADRCKLTLHLGNGDTLVMPRINGPVTQGGGDCANTHEGIALNATTQVNTYTATYTYPNAGIYKIFMYDPNRNANVINVPSSVNQPFYLESLLIINNFTGANTAPDFTALPLDLACFGICFYHNPGAFDIDGDSLSYAVTQSRGYGPNGIGSPIPGYAYPNDAPPPSQGTYSIDPVSGTLAWCSPHAAGEYNLAFIVYEWRKNTAGVYNVIGYVLRDMQVRVQVCPGNFPPDFNVPQDTCVVAGAGVTKTITVTDGNPNNLVIMYGYGGPFTTTNPLASLTPPNGIVTYNTVFQWVTNCGLIRRQPYQITLKAEDQQTPKLTVFKTFNIRVVPPAVTNVSATPMGSNIKVTWALSNCFASANPIARYEVYRKSDCVAPVYQPCDLGAPAGFDLVGTVASNVSQFIDTNNGQGLVVGQDYSYVVVVVYKDGSTSFGSSSVCTKLKRDVPILLNVDVRSTAANGSVWIRWANPLTTSGNLDTIAFPGPYTYNLLFKPVSASTYSVVHTLTQSQFYQLFNAASTTFTHNGVNTLAEGLDYKVEFVANTTTVGASQRATSVFLTAAGGERKVKLSWTSQTPWNNYKYTVFRKMPWQASFTSSVGVTSLTAFTDSLNVYKDSTYCYYILSEGKYSDPSIEDSLMNRSEEACGTAVDVSPPCAPTLSVISDCITGFISLTWNNVNLSCARDVKKYCLYKKETEDGDFAILDTIYGPFGPTVSYQFDNLPEIAGCFAVAAIDSTGNVGSKGTEDCIDNCPEFDLPNIFTPNKDGANDFFKAVHVRHIKEIDLYVYDRWGTLVYKTTDPLFKWDGTSIFSNRPVSDGTLFYICDVYEKRVKGPTKRSLKGWVQVAK
jgi:gliding motility-associated-like protein